MWTELTRADLDGVKRRLQARRAEMLARHAEELKALDVSVSSTSAAQKLLRLSALP